MGDLLIRNVSEAMKSDLNRLADLTEGSLSEAAKLALGEGIEIAKRKLETAGEVGFGDRLRAAFAGAFHTNDEAEEFHLQIERERKSDFGRPLPDFE